MSIHKRDAPKPYEVRWTEPSGRQRSRSFTRHRDATRFDDRVKLLKEQGRLAELDAEGITLAQFGAKWWQHTKKDLAAHTRRSYEQQWNNHILPRLGTTPLAAITALTVEEFRTSMEKDGAGAPTVRFTMAVLQSALARAVIWGYLRSNPAQLVRKPAAKPKRREPIPPIDVERMRLRHIAAGRPLDALLVTTLGYAGLRPEEALALTWADVSPTSIRVERAVAFGEGKATKTEHVRTVRLLAPLARDLEAMRPAKAAAKKLIWAQAGNKLWADHTYRNWRKRVYQPTARKARLEDLRPYTLRASFASLLIAEGRTIVEVARQCGHSVETCSRHYALLFEAFDGRSIGAEDAIFAARARCGDLRCGFAETFGEH